MKPEYLGDAVYASVEHDSLVSSFSTYQLWRHWNDISNDGKLKRSNDDL